MSHGGGRGTTFFACNDPEYDDRGPGSYLYPLEYENRAGFQYKVIIGGGPTSQEYADEIGADGYGETAFSAVELCSQLIGEKK